MNLTGQGVYQKGQSFRKKPNRPTAAQRRRWDRIVRLGCAVANAECRRRVGIHHCFTGAGGRKDHDKVIGLCWMHHQGPRGIDGREYGMSKRKWQATYDTEQELLEQTERRLRNGSHAEEA